MPLSSHLHAHKPHTSFVARSSIAKPERETGKQNKSKKEPLSPRDVVTRHTGPRKRASLVFVDCDTRVNMGLWVVRCLACVPFFNFGVINKLAIGDGLIMSRRVVLLMMYVLVAK